MERTPKTIADALWYQEGVKAVLQDIGAWLSIAEISFCRNTSITLDELEAAITGIIPIIDEFCSDDSGIDAEKVKAGLLSEIAKKAKEDSGMP